MASGKAVHLHADHSRQREEHQPRDPQHTPRRLAGLCHARPKNEQPLHGEIAEEQQRLHRQFGDYRIDAEAVGKQTDAAIRHGAADQHQHQVLRQDGQVAPLGIEDRPAAPSNS